MDDGGAGVVMKGEYQRREGLRGDATMSVCDGRLLVNLEPHLRWCCYHAAAGGRTLETRTRGAGRIRGMKPYLEGGAMALSKGVLMTKKEVAGENGRGR